jgi:nitrous oxide reductase accessory protein NosL
MTRLRLTRHVLDMIVERGLERVWVERVAADAEWTEPSRQRQGVALRLGKIAAAGGKVLRVTTMDEGGVRVVLTAHFDRKATQAVRTADADDL